MDTSTNRRAFLGLLATASAASWTGAGLFAADALTPPSAKDPDEDFMRGLPPYNHTYHQSLVYKIFCAAKDAPDQNLVRFEDALHYIRTIHDITGGLKQIAYLVGWQFEGHDSKYPAWLEVNRHLKRAEDPDARTSFLWLAKEAKKYNALVSVHINMSDAYENSPLWKTYRDNGLISCDNNGTPIKGGVWDGEQCYYVDKVREWESGYAQKRIDAIFELLPFLRENGTVHIDAFGKIGGNPQLRNAVFGIVDYWHKQGVDMTTESIDLETIGRVPMAYHLNLSEKSRLKYPPNVLCGGGDYGNKIWTTDPEAGCLYEEAWGVSIDKDLCQKHGGLTSIVDTICTKTLVWYYLNGHRALSYRDSDGIYRVTFSDGIESTVRKADRHLTIRHGNRTLVDGGDLFVPALWTNGQWFAYSRNGGTRIWPLPGPWKDAKTVTATDLTDEGRGKTSTLIVSDGKLTITLEAGKGLAISPW